VHTAQSIDSNSLLKRRVTLNNLHSQILRETPGTSLERDSGYKQAVMDLKVN
jgi:hypothetical protein